MSDEEGSKKSGYRLEYSPSARSKCTGPKPCKGTALGKGELRVGSLVDFRGNTSFQWRHWGCVTPKIIENMKKSFEEADELDGFEELKAEDQEKVRKAWEDGKVADEDVPESARKPEGEEEDDEEKPKKKAARGSKKKAEADDAEPKKSVFKLEYASSGRSKCKACGETVGKDYFRLGNEVDFRGNKSFAWRHWGCTDEKLVGSLKVSYGAPSEIDGFGDLKEAEQEKVTRAWKEGIIPEDDKGPGEAVDTGKKTSAKRKKKEEGDDEKPKARAKRAKKSDEEEQDEEDEKPKRKRSSAKNSEKKARAPAKKRSKKDESEQSGEDFADELAQAGADEMDEVDEEQPVKKPKRAPSSKASTSSKPASKTAAKNGKPASAAKASSSRGRKKHVEEILEEEEEEDDE
ncbi:zf-PARP-domain-containing protein [Wolfiporia cocos MD-104 SS10]|uniref:Zf-PARP-domain-containing protein n=1 Tax=Wolfiporia cocos (strain MD-104) TaxID=742152 RepID=A0A2H3K6P0_WOLCO|nr:zf-PARP-domain-containing protein [Wolfiporia cocos MD-104 SS10]